MKFARGRGRWATLTALLLTALLFSGALSATATARRASTPAVAPAVPQGFVGVDVDGPMFATDTTLDYPAQLQTMVANGVQSIRVAFNWANAQPYANASQVPAAQASNFVSVGGVPTDWSLTDEIVTEAAHDRINVLPTVLYAPGWDARGNHGGLFVPKRTGPYAAFAAALVKRYGPHGSFWSANPGLPRVPIHDWQIWNEPDLSYAWPQPFAASYIPLLRAARTAIKHADPHAQIVLGAMTNFAWRDLSSLYKRGAKNLFDIVSINGFTKNPADWVEYMQFVRRAMSHYQDGKKPMMATEISWPSAQGKSTDHNDFNTTEKGQAQDITKLMPLIQADYKALHLVGIYWYTWITTETKREPAFDYAGLLKLAGDGYTVTAKPSLAAYKRGALKLEHCRAKGSVATACLH